MQAVVFEGPGKWKLRAAAEPRLESSDEVLLEVERAGICGTDLHIIADPPGHPATPGTILGHEYVARVVETGREVTRLRPGDRVVVDPNIACGSCEYCLLGKSNLCTGMTTLGIFRHGGLARYSVAPVTALYPVGPDVAPERAVLAEPLTCVYAACEKAPPGPTSSVVVLGAGPVGLMFILLYRLLGAETVVAVEPQGLRRRVALQLGADRILEPGPKLQREFGRMLPLGADIVVDAVGVLLGQALELTKSGGRVVLFGMNQRTPQSISQYDITRRELTVTGSFIQRHSFPGVTRLLQRRDFPIEQIVTHTLPLSRIGEAFESMRRGAALKVVLKPEC